MNTILVLCILVLAIHFIVGTVYWIIDKRFNLEKIQKNVTVSDEEYFRIFRRSTLNVLTITLPLIVACLSIPRYHGMHPQGPITFASAIIILGFTADIIAYWIHRAMHIPFMYDNFHFLHHELTSPVAYGTLDAHPVEVATWDFLPIILPVHLFGASDLLTIVFSCMLFTTSMIGHSGYYYFSDASHDLHHERRKCNYASIVTDKMFGTYIEREKGREYPRFDKQVKDLEGSRNIWLKS